MTKRVRTMEEFAQAVGLSRPTVSKYFQDASSIRPKLRERIEEGLRQTGFRPNLFAVNLNRRQTKIVGLIFPNSLDPFYAGLRRQIEDRAAREGYLTFVFSSDGKPEMEEDALETLSQLNAAGVILSPVGGDAAHRARIKATARSLPIVFIDSPFDEEEAFVGTNNNQSMALMTDYLSRFGEGPSYFDMPHVNANGAARREAYAQTMRRRGLEPRFVAVEPSASWDFERYAFEQTQRLLAGEGFPTKSLLCGNDRIAFGVMAALNQAGRRIGLGADCEFRVAGHDNQPLSEYIWPPLTTVQQNTGEMGRLALDLLLQRLDPAREAQAEPERGRHLLVDGDLVLRASA